MQFKYVFLINYCVYLTRGSSKGSPLQEIDLLGRAAICKISNTAKIRDFSNKFFIALAALT